MACLMCGSPIIGRRKDSLYCSASCSRKAKEQRKNQRLIKEATQQNHAVPYSPVLPEYTLHGFTEIRELEKDKYNTISELKERYESKIRELETSGLNKDFDITRLKDKILELERKHEKEIREASTNTTKETVKAITAMPAIQSALGALAGNLIPNAGGSLGGVEDTYNITEKQIIESTRKMQPEAQQYLVQMLYFLFSKEHEEQMQIFSALTAYMQGEEAQDDDV